MQGVEGAEIPYRPHHLADDLVHLRFHSEPPGIATAGRSAGDRNGGPIRMAVRLAESLLELGRFDPQDIVGRYLRWWREGPSTPAR